MRNLTAWWAGVAGFWLLTQGCGEPLSKPVQPDAQTREYLGFFHNLAGEMGVDFVHQDGRSGQRFYVETAASGGGFLDYDQDGDLDLYLINGAATPGYHGPPMGPNRLYENRMGRYVDVTEASGTGDRGYGMGMCVGDVDGDGQLDFFVTNYGPDRLFRNLGKGRFEEISVKAGVAGKAWGTGCAFADLDMDGDLDLYVANYVDFRFEQNPKCGDAARNLASYCRPDVFRGQRDYLYINDGTGTFTEEGQLRGIASGLEDKGFGVVISDADEDGDPDILVANDGTRNRLYLNDGTGHFRDVALEYGFAFNRNGMAESCMGLALGDVNRDGTADVLVTNYAFETNTLYLTQAGGHLLDQTIPSGLAEPSRLWVGWGAQFLDADNDGNLDVAIANGHVLDNVAEFEPSLSYPQPNQLFMGKGDGAFVEVGESNPKQAVRSKVSRGLAVGDIDNDGRLDLLITNAGDTIDLLGNRHPVANHWLGLVLVGPPGNVFAIGTKVRLSIAGQYTALREVRSGGGFLSQDDLRLHFGLGSYQGSLTLEVRWPDGRKEIWETDQLDRYWTLKYGQGEKVKP